MTTMPTATAAWIRQHAWTGPMRKSFNSTPGAHAHCPCQYGPSGHCAEDNHRRCNHQPDQPRAAIPETWICDRQDHVLGFRRWTYQHPTDTITGRRRLSDAAVWLADRKCIWHCPCDCHDHGGPVGAQLDLFAALAPSA